VRILFVNPPVYDVAALDLWAKPLGLLVLAAAARMCGCDVALLDFLDVHLFNECDARAGLRPPVHKQYGTAQYPKQPAEWPLPVPRRGRTYFRYGISHEHALCLLASMHQPDLVVVTSHFTYTYPGVQDAIRIVRAAFPRVPVWLGGLYAQLCTEHARLHAGADDIITSADVQAFMERIAARTAKIALPAHAFARFAYWPAPALDLYHRPSYIPVRSSRGCVNACAYCATPHICPRFEERDPVQTAEEILRWCAHFSVRDIAWYDDALLVHAGTRLLPLLQHVCAVRPDLRWHTPNGLHLRYMTPQLAERLHAAGFTTLRFGLETINRARLAATGAKYKHLHVARAMNALRSAGFAPHHIGVYILMGLPGQSAEEVRSTILYVREHFGIKAKLAEFSPVPQTALWARAVAESSLPIVDEPLWHNNSLLPLRSRVFTDDVIAELRALAVRA